MIRSVPQLDAEAHYDTWAPDFDHDLVDEFGYHAPVIAAAEAAARIHAVDAALLDAACGTGLSGEALARSGFRCIDGVDISGGMLAQARAKRIYRRLLRADLGRETRLPGCAYDGVICVCGFMTGHLGPEAMLELLRLVRPGAPLIVYLSERAYVDQGHAWRLRALEASGVATVAVNRRSTYTHALPLTGRLVTVVRTHTTRCSRSAAISAAE